MLVKNLTLALALAGSLLTASAQQSLADLVSEAQAEWMFGSWEGWTDNGDKMTHSFGWELDKKVVVMKGKIGEMAYLGVTSMDPKTGEPKYAGYDNQGGVSKGTWADESGDLALTVESTSPTEGTRKFAVVFGKTSGGGLEFRMHGVDEWGYLNYPAMGSIEMKKAKK